jgi:hypothetical protein
MALGEYVSVSSQRDSQRALMVLEKRELAASPEAELTELTALYEAKGLSAATARTVATELTSHGALAAHLDAELHIDPADIPSPVQAAAASALSFTADAVLPLLAILLPPATARIPRTFARRPGRSGPGRGPQRSPGRQQHPPRRPAAGHRRSTRPGLHLRHRAPVRHRPRLTGSLVPPAARRNSVPPAPASTPRRPVSAVLYRRPGHALPPSASSAPATSPAFRTWRPLSCNDYSTLWILRASYLRRCSTCGKRD